MRFRQNKDEGSYTRRTNNKTAIPGSGRDYNLRAEVKDGECFMIVCKDEIVGSTPAGGIVTVEIKVDGLIIEVISDLLYNPVMECVIGDLLL